MFHSVARGIVFVLFAPVSVISALFRSRNDKKTAADRILETRGLKAAEFYSARLDHRVKEEHRVEPKDRVKA